MTTPNDDARKYGPDSETRCITRSALFKHRHTWTIENFGFHRKDKVLRSSTFGARGYDRLRWAIELYPRGNSKVSRDYFSLFLCLVSANVSEVRVHFKFTLLDSKQEEIEHAQDLRTMKSNADWGFYEFVKADDVIKRPNQLSNDEISVRCDMCVAVYTTNVPMEIFPTGGSRKFNATNLLKEFLENPPPEDPAPSSAGKGFHIREPVLKAFSPVLKAMFERDFSGTGSSRKEISEMDENTFVEFVRFIYADDEKAPDRLTKYLLAAMDKYGVDETAAAVEPTKNPRTQDDPSGEERPAQFDDQQVSRLATEAERLQISGAVPDESSMISLYQSVMQPGDHMTNAETLENVSQEQASNTPGELQVNHPNILPGKSLNGEDSEDDSVSSKFSVLGDS